MGTTRRSFLQQCGGIGVGMGVIGAGVARASNPNLERQIEEVVLEHYDVEGLDLAVFCKKLAQEKEATTFTDDLEFQEWVVVSFAAMTNYIDLIDQKSAVQALELNE